MIADGQAVTDPVGMEVIGRFPDLFRGFALAGMDGQRQADFEGAGESVRGIGRQRLRLVARHVEPDHEVRQALLRPNRQVDHVGELLVLAPVGDEYEPEQGARTVR